MVQGVSTRLTFRAYSPEIDVSCAYSFSAAVSRLFELGVPTQQYVTPEPWIIPTVEEQKEASKAS